ncbi:hypothetical protein [Geodermatophilus sp. CPCC 205506]|uniref:hypothetical protein n=1 Tax=Geodermatophilus sp. CPCC 205506 TaxID=2936596 RepID=UPI003EED0316
MTKGEKSNDRFSVPGLSRAQLGDYLCDILGEGSALGMTRREMHAPLWERLPAQVKSSWVVLRVGDEISKTLSDLEKHRRVGHDADAGLWWLASRPRPERPVYIAEKLFDA